MCASRHWNRVASLNQHWLWIERITRNAPEVDRTAWSAIVSAAYWTKTSLLVIQICWAATNKPLELRMSAGHRSQILRFAIAQPFRTSFCRFSSCQIRVSKKQPFIVQEGLDERDRFLPHGWCLGEVYLSKQRFRQFDKQAEILMKL